MLFLIFVSNLVICLIMNLVLDKKGINRVISCLEVVNSLVEIMEEVVRQDTVVFLGLEFFHSTWWYSSCKYTHHETYTIKHIYL